MKNDINKILNKEEIKFITDGLQNRDFISLSYREELDSNIKFSKLFINGKNIKLVFSIPIITGGRAPKNKYSFSGHFFNLNFYNCGTFDKTIRVFNFICEIFDTKGILNPEERNRLSSFNQQFILSVL